MNKYKFRSSLLLCCLLASSLHGSGQNLKERIVISNPVATLMRWYAREIETQPRDSIFVIHNQPFWEKAVIRQHGDTVSVSVPVYQLDRIRPIVLMDAADTARVHLLRNPHDRLSYELAGNIIAGRCSGVINEYYSKNPRYTEQIIYTVTGLTRERGHLNEQSKYVTDWSPALDSIKLSKLSAEERAKFYVPTYAMRAYDNAIQRKMEQEDEEADAQRNIDCRGQSSIGVQPLRGKMLHWLIKLDFLSTGPQREVDFKLPADSSYIDLADRNTYELFLLVADDPEQIKAGIKRMGVLVKIAQVECDTRWHAGTVYSERVLKNPNKGTMTLKLISGTGVVVYAMQKK